MKALATLLVGGMFMTGTGCLDTAADPTQGSETSDVASNASDAEQAGSFEEVVARHCDRNNQLPNNVPVRDASGVFTTVSAQGFIDL
ncbi:MAG TPA: hypothetical protein VHN14_04050, partial [Kofleriaceae bacterium]|nr:hypothetical protein [Kofleriaceae bacterium]